MLHARSDGLPGGEIHADATADVSLICTGIFLLDFMQTLWFEWWLIHGRIHFRWSYIPYFLARYFGFAIMIIQICAICLNPATAVMLVLRVAPVLGCAAVACSSLNLMIRGFTLWSVYRPKHRKKILFSVVTATVIYWGLLFGGTVTEGMATRMEGNNIILPTGLCLSSSFLYTVSYDLAALVLTVSALASAPSRTSLLRSVLLKQEYLYFIIACIANFIPAVLSLTNHPFLMGIMVMPAITAEVVASSRMVTWLIQQYVEHIGPEGLHLARARSSARTRTPVQLTTQFGVLPPDLPIYDDWNASVRHVIRISPGLPKMEQDTHVQSSSTMDCTKALGKDLEAQCSSPTVSSCMEYLPPPGLDAALQDPTAGCDVPIARKIATGDDLAHVSDES